MVPTVRGSQGKVRRSGKVREFKIDEGGGTSGGSLSKAPAAAATNAPTPFWSSDEQRIRAEIYWVLLMIDSQSSFNSAAGISDLFRLMFF